MVALLLAPHFIRTLNPRVYTRGYYSDTPSGLTVYLDSTKHLKQAVQTSHAFYGNLLLAPLYLVGFVFLPTANSSGVFVIHNLLFIAHCLLIWLPTAD
jgi:hypothetical protein